MSKICRRGFRRRVRRRARRVAVREWRVGSGAATGAAARRDRALADLARRAVSGLARRAQVVLGVLALAARRDHAARRDRDGGRDARRRVARDQPASSSACRSWRRSRSATAPRTRASRSAGCAAARPRRDDARDRRRRDRRGHVRQPARARPRNPRREGATAHRRALAPAGSGGGASLPALAVRGARAATPAAIRRSCSPIRR